MISNREAIDMLSAISRILQSPDQRSTKFNYALIRNKKLIDGLITACNETLDAEDNPGFAAWRAECDKLRAEYARRDEHGNFIMLPDNLPAVADDKLHEFNAACNAMLSNTEWRNGVERRAKAMSELMQADAKIDLYPIILGDVPNSISVSDLESIYPLIHE